MILNYKKYVEEYGKIKGFLITIYVFFYQVYRKIIVGLAKRFCKINDHIIVFESTPDYSDNSRALSNFLIENKYTDRYKIYWNVADSKAKRNQYPNDNVTFIEKQNKFHVQKLSSCLILNKAKYMITTHGFPLPINQRRIGQRFIWLWHGSSYKGKSENDGKGKKDKHGDFGFFLVAGPLFKKVKADFFNVSENYICPLGFPRYDWILKKTDKAFHLKERFTKNNQKLIIWMPTFRNHPEGIYSSIKELKSFPLMSDYNDWFRLDKYCQENNLVILIKIHIFQIDYGIDFNQFKNIRIITNEVFDKANVNMYEFLAVTDALITDYSSVAVDYLIVNRPIAYSLDDYEVYKEKRGFVFEDPRKYMPGHHLYKFEDIFGFLSDVTRNNDIYKDDRKKMMGVAVHKSNNYCKEIADRIGLK